jgi:hypothetical protein
VLGDVRFGSKANMRLPLIDVRFVLIAEIALTYSITSSTREWRRQYVETEFFHRSKLDKLDLAAVCKGRSAGFSPFFKPSRTLFTLDS